MYDCQVGVTESGRTSVFQANGGHVFPFTCGDDQMNLTHTLTVIKKKLMYGFNWAFNQLNALSRLWMLFSMF